MFRKFRGGTMMPMVLGVVFVGVILVVSLQDTIVARYRHSGILISNRSAENLCQSVLDGLSYDIQIAALDPKSQLVDFFRNNPDEEMNILEFLPDYEDDLAEIARKFGDGEILHARAFLQDVRGLKAETPDWSWHDPGEKIGTLTLEIGVQVDTVKRFLRAKRKFQLTNILPGPLGRFSLFVKKPDAEGNGYNRVLNFSDGSVPVNSPKPLVIYNNLFGGNPELNGWVFLGGEASHSLHLTSGSGWKDDQAESFGENFHFFPVSQTPATNPAFLMAENKPLDSGPWIVSGQELGSLMNTSFPGFLYADFALVGELSGFFSRESPQSSPEKNMNTAVGLLDYWFSGTEPLTMQSSILHLTGDGENPSPTFVIGKVFRRFAQYSRANFTWFFADSPTPSDGNFQGTLAYLKNPSLNFWQSSEEEFWPEANSSIPWSKPGTSPPKNATQVYLNGVPQWVELANQWQNPQQGFSALMGVENPNPRKEYVTFCSRLISEPYNSSNQYFFQSPNQEFFSFPPKSFSYQEYSELADGRHFVLKLKGEGVRKDFPAFEGDLEKISPEIISYKPTYWLSFNELTKRFVRLENGKKIFEFQSNVYIDEPLVEIGPWESRDSSGILYFSGDVVIRGLGMNRNLAFPEESLTICAGGNIILDTVPGYQVFANLIALRGKIRRETCAESFGSQCSETLPWDGLKMGGSNEYNTNADPSTELYSFSDRLFFSDEFHSFEMAPEPFFED